MLQQTASSFGSSVVVESFDSKAQRCNPLGDPHQRPLLVYLPPNYHHERRPYPTVYLLPPLMATGSMEMNEGPWQETIQQRLDRLIASGQLPPMIVVLPNLSTRYGGSQYLNSTATGNYADCLLELVAFVDGRFRTRADRDHRALAGKSSGGYGALMTAMRRPDLFGLVADHSGDKRFELCYQVDFPKFTQALARVGGLKPLLEDPWAARYRYGFDLFFHAIHVPAMASCYSPNPDAVHGFDLPVDPVTCELRDDVWQRWLQHDPARLIEPHDAALRSLRLLYLDCGSRDEFNLHYSNRIFTQHLAARNIAHRYEEFDDGHRQTQLYRYDVSLTAIGAALPIDD